MKRAVKLLLVCIMLALIPLRGLAAVTVGICALGEHGAPALAEHDHGMQDNGGAPDEDGTHDCGACTAHCAGASFVAQRAPVLALHQASAGRIAHGEPHAAAHIPEHLDPPPLAL